MRQLENDATFDEIDRLKIEINNGYNTDGNIYRRGIIKYATDLRTERDMDPKEKADRLANVRRSLGSRNGNKYNSNRVNYQAAKPIMDKRLQQLNQIIKSGRDKEIYDERVKISYNINSRVPKYENPHNKSALNSMGHTDRIDYRKPLMNDSPQKPSSMSRRNDRLTDRVDKSFNNNPKENRSVDPRQMLPDIGAFKQNKARATDLEKEERAIMNMYAQDFDDLNVLNMLSGNDELYKHKLKQYKETSNARLQAEKVLQQQRLEMLRLHYSRENYEEERKMQMDQWAEEQEKGLISRRIHERLNAPKTPEYREPTPVEIVRANRPINKEPEYDPVEGLVLHVDYVANMQRGMAKQCKIAYAIFNKGDMLIGNKQMGPVLVTPDEYSVMQEKAQFTKKTLIKDIDPDVNSNLIFEVQVPRQDDPYVFDALGWTLINVFEFENQKLNVGAFKLPLYQIPTNPNLSVNDILSTLTPIDSYMCIRISVIGDRVNQMKSDMHPSEYTIPDIHQRHKAGLIPDFPKVKPMIAPQVHPTIEPKVAEKEDELKRDPFYSNLGLFVFLSYLKNFPVKPSQNLRIRCSLFFMNNAVMNDNKEA